MSSKFYEEFLLYNIPRVLSQIDRDIDSKTFGSCDRNYWHYKIRDFSSAILQQSCLTLAILHTVNFDGNKFYKNNQVLIWAKGILRFWQKVQLKNGSFNEYYPNEQGFPPTAFTLYAVAETYKRLELDDESLINSMKRSAYYLTHVNETEAFNQQIAAITGLYSLYTITKDEWILKAVEFKLANVLRNQSEEGWFPEYGGADFGYLSVSLDMLGEYYWLSKDKAAKRAIERLVEFLKYFCHPNHTYGGEYGSRNTIYFLPNGLEVLLSIGNEDALLIKNHLFKDHVSINYHNSIDDRYFAHYVLHSYARAIEKCQVTKGQLNTNNCLPCFSDHWNVFKDSGLVTLKNKDIFAVVSLKKGGTIRVFKDDKEIYADYGYRYTKKDALAATNWLDNNYSFTVDGAGDILVKGNFNLIKQQISTPIKHFCLRILSSIFGRFLIKTLKKKLIFINNKDETNFIRRIKISENDLKITDEIFPISIVNNFHSAPIYSCRHVASGKFFQESELLGVKNINIESLGEPIRIMDHVNLTTLERDVSYEKL